jgi:serine/threonine-protein kinase
VAHSALANVESWYDWDFAAADREFRRALELAANDPTTSQQYAAFLLAAGRHAEAVARIGRAQRLDPVSLPTDVQAARIFFFKRDYGRAIAECRKILDIDPAQAGAHQFLGRVYAQQGLYAEALRELELARSRVNNAEVLSLIGYTYAISGQASQATAVLSQLRELSARQYVSPYHPAMVEGGLGDRDDAFKSLEKAYEEREGRLTIIRFAPEFSALHADPRFANLVARIRPSDQGGQTAGRTAGSPGDGGEK